MNPITRTLLIKGAPILAALIAEITLIYAREKIQSNKYKQKKERRLHESKYYRRANFQIKQPQKQASWFRYDHI